MAILAAPVRKITGARVASRGVNYPLLGLAFIGLAIAKVMTVWWEMEKRLPESSFGTEGCTRYRNMMSPEDIVPVFDGVFVGSSDERRQHMMRSIGAEAAPWGDLVAIWNVDTPGKDPKTALLEIEGFPEGTAFHPHGMHYRPETGELFVVNHAYSQGGERIDVFKVSETFPQDALPSIDPSLLELTPTPPDEEEGEEQQEEEEEEVAEAAPGEVDGGSGDGSAAGDIGGATNAGEGSDEESYGIDAGAQRIEGAGDGGIDGDAAGGENDRASALEVNGGQEAAEISGDETSGDYTAGDAPEGAVAGGVAAEDEEEGEEEKEEIVESPKEIARRLKKEAKEAASRAKSEERRRLAEERAAAKAAAAVKAARAKGLARGVAPLKLTYSFTVEHEVINNNYGVLNDLVLASDDELYVTQYLAMRHPLHGPTQPDGILERLQVYGSILCLLLQMSPAPVIRCTGIRGADIACERLARGRGAMYNGIALSPNGERLLVSDTVASQMVVFNRSLETGALTLRQRLDLPASPDNLELDLYRAAEGTEAYTVGLVRAIDYFQYSTAMDGATHPSDGDDKKMAGGVASIVFDKESGKYESSLEMWQDGSLLSISSAAPTRSGARLMGSAVEEGFLLCHPPPCPLGSEGANGVCPWGPPPNTEPPSTQEGSAEGDSDEEG